MNHVLIIHDVQDYDAWKRVFDAAASMRHRAGELRFHLLRDERLPNRVVHFSQWVSLDQARAFFESPALVALRRDAGVEAPVFHYLTSLEVGTL